MPHPICEYKSNERALELPAVVDAGDVEELFALIAVSDESVVEESERTRESTREVFAKMQAQFISLSEENLKLRQQLAEANGRHGQLEIAHKGEIDAWKGKAESAERSVEVVKKEMTEVVRKTDESMAKVIAAQNAAVQTAIQAGDARVAAVRQETEARLNADHKVKLSYAYQQLTTVSNTLVSDVSWYQTWYANGNKQDHPNWRALEQAQRAKCLVDGVFPYLQ